MAKTKKKKSTLTATRRSAWILRDRAMLIEQTKRHPSQSFQSALDDIIDAALRQRRLLPSAETAAAAQPEA